MVVNEFISKFHNLDGNTIGEKRKNLFILLQNIPPDHDEIITSIVSRNSVERYYKLELLLHLKRLPELTEIFKNEDEYLPAKLLKNTWFCQKLSALLDESENSDFVSNILPFTSFVIRNRLLTKLAKYGTKLDAIFDEVCVRYGISTASGLLVACSESKIEDILEKHKVHLNPYYQKLFYQKHSQLFLRIFTKSHIDDSVLSYIARHNIDDYLEMVEKSDVSTKLGKRLTQKMLKNHRHSVNENSKKYLHIFHIKTLIRVLPENELKQFFFNCFPSTMDDGQFRIFRFSSILTSSLGKRQHYEFLKEGVEKVYNKSIYDFPYLVDEEMIVSMDLQERERWIEIKRKTETSEESLIKMMNITDAILLIKNKINVTSSVNARKNLLELVVEICKLNNDLNAVAEVCEYVCFRHRNDDKTILAEFLFSIRSSFKLEKLQERHWNSINNIFSILNRQGYPAVFKYDFYIKYVEYLFHQEKLTDENILDFLKFVKSDYRWDYKMVDKNLEKLFLLKSIELMPQLVEESEKLEYKDLHLINFILKWNQEHPKDQIVFFDNPRLVESFKKSVRDSVEKDEYISELYSLNVVFEYIICTKEKSQMRDDTLENYFLAGFRYYDTKVDFWLMKYEPEIIAANFEKFLEHVLHDYQPHLELLNLMKKYPDFDFQTKTVNYCLDKITKGEHIDKIFITLAYLIPADRFLEIVAPYYPAENKMDDDDENEESRKNGDIAIAIAKSFKYATETLVLPTLIKYCKGDFLRYALESLYYRFYHSPENQLSKFIDELSSKAVSVRKHSIFLTCIVGSVSDVKKLLGFFIKGEQSVSVQKHLFTATLKYFTKNPSDEFWEFVKASMHSLDRNDSESFQLLLSVYKIPEKYQALHVIFVWEILKRSEDLDKNRPKLLTSIPESAFEKFPVHFLLDVITENFFKEGSTCESAVNNFIISSLKQSNYESKIMDVVFATLEEIKKRSYESLQHETSTRINLSSFVSNLVESLGTQEKNVPILTDFFERWQTLFTITDAIKEHLQLSLVLLYFSENKNLEKFCSTTAEFLDTLVSKYGIIIVDCFAAELNDCLTRILSCYSEPDEDYFKFCLNLLNWNSLVFYLLVIKLLPNKGPSQDKCRELFLEIVRILRQVPQETVQVLMNLYIMDLK